MNRGVSAARYEGGSRSDVEPFEQSHLVLAFEGPSYGDSDFFTAQVFSGLFGGGMSSRLFQEVRERRGLCYSIYSSAWGLRDTGMLGVHAATGPKSMVPLIDVVGAELNRIGDEGPTEQRSQSLESATQGGPADGSRKLVRPRRADGPPPLGARKTVAERGTCRESRCGQRYRRACVRRPPCRGKPSVAVVGAGKRSPEYAAHAARFGVLRSTQWLS